jgi:hypothetical protein
VPLERKVFHVGYVLTLILRKVFDTPTRCRQAPPGRADSRPTGWFKSFSLDWSASFLDLEYLFGNKSVRLAVDRRRCVR